jgi:hypothetical protein
VTTNSVRTGRFTALMKSIQDFNIICDEPNCDSVLYINDRTWSQMVQLVKHEGWKLYKQGELWKHRCPECQGK